jgi:hypothetical protein
MSIDPNKAFGMKATNKSYTLEFRREDNGVTTLKATDLETAKMTFGQRLSAAWSILTGKKTFGDFVFPIKLRNIDFYHMSYIYRPEKVVEKSASAPAPAPKSETAAKPKAAKPKTEKAVTTEGAPKATSKPRKPRAPRQDKSEKPSTNA